MSDNPYPKTPGDKGKVFNTAIKMSIKPEMYWGGTPKDFKGNKLQWSLHLAAQCACTHKLTTKQKIAYNNKTINDPLDIKLETYQAAG
jgi:hypothetical protein